MQSELQLASDYWPLFGTWTLTHVGMDEHENSSGLESGYMHEMTWSADGSFKVDWNNEIIQVGHIQQITEVSAMHDDRFLITVILKSDCPKEAGWFEGEYVLSAAQDSLTTEGGMRLGGFSFPWGDSDRSKVMLYEKL